ncbi:hypothetical protein [Nocardioides sp.]|uniref:hypothetical protein n=1 Tax=Nocardioides sp. TaxID=35761 RepID=UPI0027341692|nr:hypothetical protein [Nocardioides sp.]MDP3890519.1 hypothetical protein [Nocardioides sp.]
MTAPIGVPDRSRAIEQKRVGEISLAGLGIVDDGSILVRRITAHFLVILVMGVLAPREKVVGKRPVVIVAGCAFT